MKKEAAEMKQVAVDAKAMKFELTLELDRAQFLRSEMAQEKKGAIDFTEQLTSMANSKFNAVEEQITDLQREIAALKKSSEESPSQLALLITEQLLPIHTELLNIKPQVQIFTDAAAEVAKKEFTPLELVQQLKDSVDVVASTIPANADKLDSLAADMQMMGEAIASLTEARTPSDDARKGKKASREGGKPKAPTEKKAAAEREEAAEKKKVAAEEEAEEAIPLVRRKRVAQPQPPPEAVLKKARTAPSGSSQPKTTTPSSTSTPSASPKLKWSLVPKKVQPAVFQGLLKSHQQSFWPRDGDDEVPRDFVDKWEELKDMFIKWYYGFSRLPKDDATVVEVWKIFLYLYQKQDVVEKAKELEKKGKLNLARVPPKRTIGIPKVAGFKDPSMPPHEARVAASILGIDKAKNPEEFAELTADIHGLYGFPVSD